VAKEKKFEIRDPLVIMFEGPDGDIVTHIHRGKRTHEDYGLLVCDLVRHVARAFDVEEAAIWRWVDAERARPTTAIRLPS
jgi:hypothetical protein